MTETQLELMPLETMEPLSRDEQDDASFQAQDLAWAAVVGLFLRHSETNGLTYKTLGDRIGRSRQQVQRWLASAFNMNTKSLGLLAEGLDADLVIEVRPRDRTARIMNQCHPSDAAHATWISRGAVIGSTPSPRLTGDWSSVGVSAGTVPAGRLRSAALHG